jgi:hypothetical protein
MRGSQRFNFIEGFDALGVADAVPKMPLTLTYRDASIDNSDSEVISKWTN